MRWLWDWLRKAGLTTTQLKPSDHFFRHIGKTLIDGDFVDPAAFRLRTKDGQIEKGLSINWVEYFQKPTPQEAISALMEIFRKKGRKVGGESRFALLKVEEAKNAAAKYTTVAVVLDNKQKDDPSHALVTGYEKYNNQVAEELAKVIINKFPPKP